MPMMPLSGVRISCDTMARKRDLARLAASAWSRASHSARSASTRSVTSRPTLCTSAPLRGARPHHHVAPGDPARAVAAGDLLIMHPGAVGLERGVALLDHLQGERGAGERFARRSGERAERVVDEGDAALAVAAHDDVALGLQKAAGPLLDLLELPVAVGELLDAVARLLQLRPQSVPGRHQETDGAAGRAEQRRGADREQVGIVVRPGAARAGQKAERHRKRHHHDERRPQGEPQGLPAEQQPQQSNERPHVATRCLAAAPAAATPGVGDAAAMRRTMRELAQPRLRSAQFPGRFAGRVKERLTWRRGVQRGSIGREAVAQPRHPAGIVARQAGPAHLGPHRIDRARGRDPDLARERHAAIAVAAHAPQRIVDERGRDAVEIGIRLGGEARPLLGIGAARPAALAERRIVRRQVGGADGKLRIQLARMWLGRRDPRGKAIGGRYDEREPRRREAGTPPPADQCSPRGSRQHALDKPCHGRTT